MKRNQISCRFIFLTTRLKSGYSHSFSCLEVRLRVTFIFPVEKFSVIRSLSKNEECEHRKMLSSCLESLELTGEIEYREELPSCIDLTDEKSSESESTKPCLTQMVVLGEYVLSEVGSDTT